MKNSDRFNSSIQNNIFVILIVVLVLGATTFGRNAVLHDEVSAWSDVIQKSPMKGRAFDALGYYYMSVGDYRGAVNSYLEAVRREPYFDDVHLDLARAYERCGEYEKAIKAAQNAVYWTEFWDRNKARHHIFLGDLYFKVLNLPGAMKEFAKASRIEPENDYLYLKMGLIYRASGNFDEAVMQLQKAIALAPNNKINKSNLDEVYVLKLKQSRK